MQKSHLPGAVCACVFFLVSIASHAALVSRHSGQAAYDTGLDITWLSDANLAARNSLKPSADLQGGLGNKTVVVLDANNNQVGILSNAASNAASVIVEKDGNAGLLRVQKDGYMQTSDNVLLAYTQAGCLGTPIILDDSSDPVILPVAIRDGQGYVPTGISPPVTEFISSAWIEASGKCVTFPATPVDVFIEVYNVEVGSPIDLSGFTPPFRYGTSP